MEFDDDVREVVSFTNDKKRIEQGLGELGRGDATAVYDAVYLASQRLGETKQDAGRRRVLVLITDGDNTVKGVKYDEAVAAAQKAGVMIYALIVVPIASDAGRNTGGEHALIQMANDTGGKYYYIEDPKDLGPAFDEGFGRSADAVCAWLLCAGADGEEPERWVSGDQGDVDGRDKGGKSEPAASDGRVLCWEVPPPPGGIVCKVFKVGSLGSYLLL